MADMRLLHLRKSYRLSAPPHWVPSYSQLTLVISCVCLSISRSSAVLSVNPGKTCLACSLSSPLTVRVSVIPPSQAFLADLLLWLVLPSISSTSSLMSTLRSQLIPQTNALCQVTRRTLTISEVDPYPLQARIPLSASPPPRYQRHLPSRHIVPS